MTLIEEADRIAADALAPLSDLADYLGGFVAFPTPEARDAVTLWVIHTHTIGAAATTPRLSIRSAEKQCGKSRLLQVLELVAARPILTANTSVAALFRSIGDTPPAILWDEVDALFKGGSDPGREDLRALLNSGYRRGASVLRMVGEGKKMEVKAFPTFAPVALAGIGSLPDTVSDRSVIVEMRRRLPGERVRPFRLREVRPEATAIRARLETWAAENLTALETARPALPHGLSDRAEDLWEPLLAIADLAGGSWPKRARKAASELAKVGQDQDGSWGVRLLTDLRGIFGKHHDPEALPTATLLEELVALEESPWGDLRGRQLDARGLARRLRPHDVRPAVVRLGAVTARCYRRADLIDSWERYLPPGPPQTVTSETSVTGGASEVSSREQTPPDVVNVSDVTHVTVPQRGVRAEAQGPSVAASNDHLPPSVAAALRIFPDARLVKTAPLPEPSPVSVVEGLSAVFAEADSAEEPELMAQHWAGPLAALPEPKRASLRKLYRARLRELGTSSQRVQP